MSRVFVHGWGVVSPAGWGREPFRQGLAQGLANGPVELVRAGARPLPVRRVPPPATRPPWQAQPRLRRASPISQFMVGTAWEALGGFAGTPPPDIVCSVMGGSVLYSGRFYAEVRQDPATASPLLFPETVFNAPASHLGAVLGGMGRNDTLVADQTGFLTALALAAEWLDSGRSDACLVVGAEEVDWTTAEAARLFRSDSVISEGAAALWLKREPSPLELQAITSPQMYRAGQTRRAALAAVLGELAWEAGEPTFGADPSGRAGGVGRDLVPGWGDGLGAVGGWACVAALESLVEAPRESTAAVWLAGANLQAMGARFRAA